MFLRFQIYHEPDLNNVANEDYDYDYVQFVTATKARGNKAYRKTFTIIATWQNLTVFKLTGWCQSLMSSTQLSAYCYSSTGPSCTDIITYFAHFVFSKTQGISPVHTMR